MERTIWLRSVCEENNVEVRDEQLEKLSAYVASLLKWNKSINLISRQDEENIWTRHILHSLCIVFKLEFPSAARVLDLGTGGGLPGIPLKILLPRISLTLLDSTQKKIKVVESIIRELSLEDTVAVWDRVEEAGKQPAHRKQYNIILARAVAPLKDLIRWSLPLVKERARPVRAERPLFVTRHERARVDPPGLIALKGGDIEGEIGAVKGHRSVRSVTILDLTLRGSTQLEDPDKKIVLVNF